MKKLDLTYKHIILYVLTFLIIVLGDQITKVIVDHTLQLGGAYTIIEDFFYFTYYQNQGAAWSILFEAITCLSKIDTIWTCLGFKWSYR